MHIWHNRGEREEKERSGNFIKGQRQDWSEVFEVSCQAQSRFKMCVYGCFITSSVLLLLLMASVCSQACNGPFIHPPRLLVRYGDPAQANCTTDEPSMMGWETPVGATSGEGVAHLVWTVANLTEWGLKGIQCFTVSDTKGQCLGDLNITIYKPPTRVSIDVVNDAGGIVEGHRVYLECVIEDVAPRDHVKVTWFKGQELLSHALISNTTVHGDVGTNVTLVESLELTASRGDHGAQYRCEAELELEGLQPHPVKSSQPVGISVLFAPEIKCPSKVQRRENERLPNCTAEGNPSAEVTWFKGHQQVDSQSALSREDGGLYTVKAKNSFGDANQTVDVDILYGPTITCPSPGYKAQVKENDRLPECTASGNPFPEVIWSKGAMAQVDPQLALSRTQGGQYTVTARNSVATVNQTLDIEILYGPAIVCPPKLEVRENEALSGCLVEGNPRPEVTWYKGDHKSNPQSRKFDPMSKLGKKDGGSYTLIAESKPYASVHGTVEVVVISKGNIISMSAGCVLLVMLFSQIFH
ncbi:peroxidasin-like [Sardina pilchardus]|uniref:peroxidasin-like n=1 Tax=Sardina pilchardus TaxID=27697 RepID=UPI002E0F0702